MRRNLIKQQDRGSAPPLGDELCMSEYKPEQQRLLLATRSSSGGLVLCDMSDREILPVRTFHCPAGCGVTRAIGLQRRRQVILLPSVERHCSPWKIIIRPSGHRCGKGGDSPLARLGQGCAMLSHLGFQRGKPGGVGGALLRQ